MEDMILVAKLGFWMGRTTKDVRIEANDDSRDRIIAATIRLLSSGGRDEVTTRAVAAEAKLQPPAIYRLFGDKKGLLDAVVDFGFTRYLDGKYIGEAKADPLSIFRTAWDVHVGFGLANPTLFTLMFGDPDANRTSPAAFRAYSILSDRVHALAAAGLLRVPEPRAVEMVAAAGSGTVFVLLGQLENDRDATLSATMREAVIAAMTSRDAGGERPNVATAAILLRALLPSGHDLSKGERTLLEELLDRLARTSGKP